jgi:hypothetical protein
VPILRRVEYTEEDPKPQVCVHWPRVRYICAVVADSRPVLLAAGGGLQSRVPTRVAQVQGTLPSADAAAAVPQCCPAEAPTNKHGWLHMQECVKRVEQDTSGEAHCTGWAFDYWKCLDRCVSTWAAAAVAGGQGTLSQQHAQQRNRGSCLPWFGINHANLQCNASLLLWDDTVEAVTGVLVPATACLASVLGPAPCTRADPVIRACHTNLSQPCGAAGGP